MVTLSKGQELRAVRYAIILVETVQNLCRIKTSCCTLIMHMVLGQKHAFQLRRIDPK